MTQLGEVKNNRSDFRQHLIIQLYRVAHWASLARKRSMFFWPIAVPILVSYRLMTEWCFQLELPAATQIGKRLIIDHGFALVVNKHTVIGDDCRLRHCVTLGCKVNPDGTQGASPRIGDRVDVGAGAIIIGNIEIGDDAIIGAGAVVTKSVPAGAVVAGNPARIIKQKPLSHVGVGASS